MKPQTAERAKPIFDEQIAKRFTLFRNTYISKKQVEAARMLSCSQGKLSEIESAKRGVDFELVGKLIKNFSLNTEWLAFGKGSPQLKKEASKSSLLTDIKDLQGEIMMLKKQLLMMQANQHVTMKRLDHFLKSQDSREANSNNGG